MNWPLYVGGAIGILLVVAAARVRGGWPRAKAATKGVFVGMILGGIASWLLSLVVVYVVSKTQEKSTFSSSVEVTDGLIRAGALFFSLMGAYVGAAFAWFWHWDAEELAKEESPRRKKKRKN